MFGEDRVFPAGDIGWLYVAVACFVSAPAVYGVPAAYRWLKGRKVKTSPSDAPAALKAISENAPSSDTALREALEREATAKALSDRADAEFRTFGYVLNAGLGALFGLGSPPKNEKNREDQSAAQEANDGEDVK